MDSFCEWEVLYLQAATKKVLYKDEDDEIPSSSGSDFDDDEDPDKIEVPGKPFC
jgi:hypothetical protein